MALPSSSGYRPSLTDGKVGRTVLYVIKLWRRSAGDTAARTVSFRSTPLRKRLFASSPCPISPATTINPASAVGESIASVKSNAGIYDPAYRERLAYHGVIFDRSGKRLPSFLKTLVEDEIRKPRNSPPLDDQDIAVVQERLEPVEDEEEQIRHQVIQHLLPKVINYTNLKTATGLSLKQDVVRYIPSYNQ